MRQKQGGKHRTMEELRASDSRWWGRFCCSAGWRTGSAPEPRWPAGLLGFVVFWWSWRRWRRPWRAGRSFCRCRFCSPGRGSGPRSGRWCGPPSQSSDLTQKNNKMSRQLYYCKYDWCWYKLKSGYSGFKGFMWYWIRLDSLKETVTTTECSSSSRLHLQNSRFKRQTQLAKIWWGQFLLQPEKITCCWSEIMSLPLSILTWDQYLMISKNI